MGIHQTWQMETCQVVPWAFYGPKTDKRWIILKELSLGVHDFCWLDRINDIFQPILLDTSFWLHCASQHAFNLPQHAFDKDNKSRPKAKRASAKVRIISHSIFIGFYFYANLREKNAREAQSQTESNTTSIMLVVIVSIFLFVNLPQAFFMVIIILNNFFALLVIMDWILKDKIKKGDALYLHYFPYQCTTAWRLISRNIPACLQYANDGLYCPSW